MTPLLKIDSLEKHIGDLHLENISLTLEPGYIFGLIGRNGAGKTTLIRTLMNLYQKDGGSVTVDGFPMDTMEREAKDRIGFVLDDFLFEEKLSIASNGKLFGSTYSHYDHNLFLKFCKRFELDPKQKAGRLSKGQKTRFQLAFALSHQAKLFIMDEPASGLDPLFRKDLTGYMQELVEDGTRSILFSTHLTADLDQIGDYIALLDEGHFYFCRAGGIPWTGADLPPRLPRPFTERTSLLSPERRLYPMIKLVLTKLGLEIRRNIPLFLFYAVCFYFLMPFIFVIIFLQLISEDPGMRLVFLSDNAALIEDFMINILTQHSAAFACGIAVVTLLLLGLTAARLPLRLPKALYVCSAGEKEKISFLKLYLAGKLTFIPLHHQQRPLPRHPAQPDGIPLPCLQSEHGPREPERGEEKMPGHGDRTQQRNLRFGVLERPADP